MSRGEGIDRCVSVSRIGTHSKNGTVFCIYRKDESDSFRQLPTLTLFSPTRSVNGKKRAALLVFPGGMYSFVRFATDGVAASKQLLSNEMAVFVLTYRCHPNVYPTPVMDALQAIRFVREHADSFDVDATRVGVLGVGSGGHLAACVGSLFEDKESFEATSLSEVSARPDFMGLIDPLITMSNTFTHPRTKENLFGIDQLNSMELEMKLSAELQVHTNTSPAFIAHIGEDKTVHVKNSLLLYEAMLTAGVSADLHIFSNSQSEHTRTARSEGMPLASAEWPTLFMKWLVTMNVIKSSE